jgi:hypothetical protein
MHVTAKLKFCQVYRSVTIISFRDAESDELTDQIMYANHVELLLPQNTLYETPKSFHILKKEVRRFFVPVYTGQPILVTDGVHESWKVM